MIPPVEPVTPTPAPAPRLCCRCRDKPAGRTYPPLCPACQRVRDQEEVQDQKIAARFNPTNTPTGLF